MKNALREALCSFGLTKREARYLISKLELGEMGEKRLMNLSTEETLLLSHKLRELGQDIEEPEEL